MSIVSRSALDPITREEWAALRAAYPNAQFLWTALRLALDRDACVALLRGEPVAPSRLDPREVQAARADSLVILIRPTDLVEGVG